MEIEYLRDGGTKIFIDKDNEIIFLQDNRMTWQGPKSRKWYRVDTADVRLAYHKMGVSEYELLDQKIIWKLIIMFNIHRGKQIIQNYHKYGKTYCG